VLTIDKVIAGIPGGTAQWAHKQPQYRYAFVRVRRASNRFVPCDGRQQPTQQDSRQKQSLALYRLSVVVLSTTVQASTGEVYMAELSTFI
jgi:hypothetical protein